MRRSSDDRLWTLLGPVFVVTAAAGFLFAWTLARDGLDPLETWLSLLFTALFGWIAFWFWLTTLGTVRVFRSRRELRRTERRRGTVPQGVVLPRTAIIMPVHNEEAEEVFARVEAMLGSLAETEHAAAFDMFVLSDTTVPDIWLREELAWARVRRERLGAPHLFYRRRANKFRKKSGNVADFCERWGNLYTYMIVLDADSVMDGPTMLELVLRMENAPRLGILQTPSVPALRRSLYARLQQFAASAYGPPIFAGLAYCFGPDATFWGHNAILRVRPFMDHCGLPGLAGRPPFGGPILSHDFVEAALMRRAGYEVRLAWDLLLGSFEQCPVSLAVAAARDRRWCQGNLQHLRLVFSPSFSWKTRIHFAVGVLFYLTSALWGLFVLSSLVVYLRNHFRTPSALGFHLPMRDVSVGLLIATLVLLFAAKGFGLLLLASDPHRSALHGGVRRLLPSALIESVASVLTAPVLMVSQVMSLTSVIFGFSVDWGAAERDETTSPWRDALQAHGWQSAVGAFVALLAFRLSPQFGLWLAPLWIGLLLAVPLAAVLSSRRWGSRLRRMGLLLGPGEAGKVSILERVRTISVVHGAVPLFEESFQRIVRDPWLNALHISLLEETGVRSRPKDVIEPLVHRVRDGGVASLTHAEAIAVLSDVWAVRTLHEDAAGRYSSPDMELRPTSELAS
jgi:membrane glycosyltransferase